MTTTTQIVKRALIRLGKLGPEQTPTGFDNQQLTETLASLHESWVREGKVRWELTDIPFEMEDPLVSRLAFAVVDDYGVSNDRYQRLKLANQRAIRDMQTYNEIPYSGRSEIEAY